MLERILSPHARKIYLAVAIGMLGYVLWQSFAHRGIVDWIDQLQAQYFFSGYYYPELTILILAIPIVVIGFIIGIFYDYLTQKGIFVGHDDAADLSKPSSNSKIEYQETTRKDVIDEVRSKFRSEIHQLKMLGFEELGFYREIVPWFGMGMGLTGFFGAVGVLANEVTRMGPNLTVNGFFILMISRKDSAYACVTKLGIKFYTDFTDGTCLNTATYKGIEYQDEAHKLYRMALSGPLSTVWAGHKQQVTKFESDGKRTCQDMSMANYFSIIIQLNNYMLKHRSKVLKPTEKKSFLSETISTVISTIVSIGILLSIVFAFAFAGNVIRSVYPACWFVRNLGVMSLLLNFLSVPACLGVSWILARIQDALFTVNGMGTKLYDNEPVPNSGQFISTKWLTLPWIPLLPVRSYLVALESNDAFNQKTYHLQPLNKINWAQVKETIRASILGYGILGLLYVAFTVWSIWECR
jgi:hypothetical protein